MQEAQAYSKRVVPVRSVHHDCGRGPHKEKVMKLRQRTVLLLMVIFVMLTSLVVYQRTTAPIASEASPEDLFVPSEIIVKFRSGATATARNSVRDEFGATVRSTTRRGVELWRLGENEDVRDVVGILSQDGLIEYAHPNYLLIFGNYVNDPNYEEQWGLNNTGQPVNPPDANGTYGTSGADIHIEDAWDITRGDPNNPVIIAVIDNGGYDPNSNFASTLWVNPDETPGNSTDDDGNGKIDDIHGWDYDNNDGDPSAYDFAAGTCHNVAPHGNQVASLIASVPDTTGIVGGIWYVKLMIFRGLSTMNAIDAIDYAVDKGADVISASWQVAPSAGLEEAIKSAWQHEVTFVTIAHNGGVDIDGASSVYPAEYTTPNIIVTAGTDQDDGKVASSNWGGTSVDLAAPGINILTEMPALTGDGACSVGSGNHCITSRDRATCAEEGECPCDPNTIVGITLEYEEGTSFAGPLVAAVAGLVRSQQHSIPAELVIKRILDTVEAVSDYSPTGSTPTVTGGRLNASGAVDNLDTTSPTAVDDLTGVSAGFRSATIQWTSTGDDATTGSAAMYEVRSSASTITNTNWLDATRSGNEPTPDPNAGETESMTVTGLQGWTTNYIALKAYDEWGNADLSNVIACVPGGMCTTHYCVQLGEEYYKSCTWTGNYGGSGCDACCSYSCTITETCSGPGQPSVACQP